MRILLISDYGAPTGGAEVQLLSMRKEFRRQGHDARLFTSSAQTGGGPSQADYHCFGTTSSLRTVLQTANPLAAWRLRQVLRDFRPDVMHVKLFLTQLSPLILPLVAQVPTVYHVVWYRPICPLGTKVLPDGSDCREPWGTACYHRGCLPMRDWPLLMVQMRLWQRWRHAFALIVANSTAVQQRLLAEGIEAREVVRHGVPVRSPRPSLRDPPLVAFAGRLVREKGVDVLLQAFQRVVKELPDARLVIAGDGPERDALRARAEELGLSRMVSMPGFVPHEELERSFESAWVQTIPSLWQEPLGIVALEAMMRGTPVVATNVGGLVEIVEHERTGYVVPRANADALASALLAVLSNRDHAERMGATGRAVALESFNESKVAARLIDLYEGLCRDATASPTMRA